MMVILVGGFFFFKSIHEWGHTHDENRLFFKSDSLVGCGMKYEVSKKI